MELEKFINSLDKLCTISTANSLVFIMGNLDEAYRGAVENIESLEADELSDALSKITAQECKEALFELFAPEQVARLGSNHFVMPSIRKSSYQKIINNTINELTKSYEENFTLTLVLDNSVREMIYTQLVVPSQGMRNILSGFNTVLDAPISQMLPALIPYAEFPVFVSFKDKSYTFEVGCVSFSKEVDLPRKTGITSPEFLKRICFHEAGHAIVYFLTRKEAPVKVVVETSSVGSAGYVKKKKREFNTKKDLKDDVMCSLGGYFAEKAIFGADDICTGSFSDLRAAGKKVTDMVNSLGFGKKLSPHFLGSPFESPILRSIEKDRDKEIQEIFETLANETEKLINDNLDTLKALARWLEEKKCVSEEEMNEFMNSLTKTQEMDFIPSLPVEHELRHMDKKK